MTAGHPSEALDRGVATIYQELDLVEDLSVADNIFLGHERRSWGFLDRRRMRRETTDLLRRVNHAAIGPKTPVRALRPAGQQIVSIARALSRNVRLLIMDEPSAILDDNEIDTLFEVVRRLTDEGVGVVYISHRLDEIARIGDRVTVLSEGTTVASGLPGHDERRAARDPDGRPRVRAAVPRASAGRRRRRARRPRRAAVARRQGGQLRAARRRGARDRRTGRSRPQ